MIGDSNLAGLLNNAGIVASGSLLYLLGGEYRRQLEINMSSPLVIIQAFALLLGTNTERQGPFGRIVNINFTTARVVLPLRAVAYISSTSGLEGSQWPLNASASPKPRIAFSANRAATGANE